MSVSQIIESMEAIEADNVNLFDLDLKLKHAFWNLYYKRTMYKNNFMYLKAMTRCLVLQQRVWFLNQVDRIGLSCNMEHDLMTLTETLQMAIEKKHECLLTVEEMQFLAYLEMYRNGIKEMDEYQEGVRNFFRIARIQYDEMYHDLGPRQKRLYPPFEVFMTRFHCGKTSYVASHGIIAEFYLSNMTGKDSTEMEKEPLDVYS